MKSLDFQDYLIPHRKTFFRLRTESAHPELYSKLSEVDRYFLTYDDKGSLTEEQVADLYQVLHAVYFAS